MSTATIPFLNRAGFFPFCAEDSPPVTDPLYDAVDFSGSGDGFAEASNAFWLLEALSFTPTGTGSAGPFSFGTALAIPTPSTTSMVSYSLSGILGLQTFGSGVITTTRSNQPQVRICLNESIVTADASYALGGGGGGDNTYLIRFVIGYDTGTSKWRLYYRMSFSLNGGYSIQNPNGRSTGTIAATGTVSALGMALNWDARLTTGTFTGTGISISTTNWTY